MAATPTIGAPLRLRLPRTGAGPADIPEGEGILAIAESQTQWGGTGNPTASFRPGVDGLLLTGGDQQGNPGNINTLPGANRRHRPWRDQPWSGPGWRDHGGSVRA